MDIANLGVRVFFAISGFLITGLLLAEHERSGEISLRRFYLRRTMRIMPAYAAFLVAVAILDAVHAVAVSRSDFAHAVTYTMNYAPQRGWYLGHLWSLGVEEQFYLLWPLALVLVTPARGWRVALGVACIVPFIRLTEGICCKDTLLFAGSFESTADALALGCLLALSRDALWGNRAYRWAVETVWVSPLLLVIGLADLTRLRSGLLVGNSLVNIAIVLQLDRVVRRPDRPFGRLLNHRILVFIGTLSYSLYLWQQLFINRNSSAAVSAFPLNILLALAAALASYSLIERPMLRQRARLEARWFPAKLPAPASSSEAAGFP